MRIKHLHAAAVRGAVVFAVMLASISNADAQSAVSDTSGLLEISEFPLMGYSTEGGHGNLFIKAKDSVATAVFYGESGKAEYRFLFNKKLIDAESVGYGYDMQKVFEQGKYEIASIEKETLKTSKKAEEDLRDVFSDIRKELSKQAPIRKGFKYIEKGDQNEGYYDRARYDYYDLAVTEFNKAIESDKSAEAYSGRGRAYARLGDYKRAISDFSEAMKLESGNTILMRDRGNAYAQAGDCEKAAADFKAAAKLDAAWYLRRGRSYLDNGNNKRAISDFNKVIMLDPRDAIPLSNRGRAYARLGDYDKAVADFEAAAKIDPSNKLIQQNLERAKKREKGL